MYPARYHMIFHNADNVVNYDSASKAGTFFFCAFQWYIILPPSHEQKNPSQGTMDKDKEMTFTQKTF